MDRLIRRLGIVNRGEPAVRALTAVAELNQAGTQPPIKTVALYTDPDADSWFVREADDAVPLGSATFVDPADGSRKVALPRRVGGGVGPAQRRRATRCGWAGDSWPSTRRSRKRCEEAGIIFVGPDSATIRRLGDKVTAKRLAEKADVPVVPWSGGAGRRRGSGQSQGRAARLPAGGQGLLRRRRTRNPDGPRRRRTAGRAAGGTQPRRRWRSATRPSSWRSSCPRPATSRCRSSPTATARRGRSASATAACSAATRR